jgi:hypothetical protein
MDILLALTFLVADYDWLTGLFHSAQTLGVVLTYALGAAAATHAIYRRLRASK